MLEINPDNLIAYDLKAHAKSLMGDYNGAIENYTKLIEIESETDPSTYITIITEHLQKNAGDYEVIKRIWSLYSI